MPLVRITCPGCRFGLQIDRALPAQITCPGCKTRFVAEAQAAPAGGPRPLPAQASRPAPAPPVRAARPAADAPWWSEQTSASPRLAPFVSAPAESQPVRWGLIA